MLLEYLQKFVNKSFTFSYVMLQYSAIRYYLVRTNTQVDFDSLHLKDFLKGAQNLCKPFLKKFTVWDPQEYVDFLQNRPLPKSAAQAAREAAALLAIAKSLRSIDLHNMDLPAEEPRDGIPETVMFIPYRDRQKTRGPHGEQEPGVEIQAYPLYPRVCVVQAVRRYIRLSRDNWTKRKFKNRNNVLFVSSTHENQIALPSIRNWLVEELADAGIVGPEGKKYTAHSYRAAGASAAYFKGYDFDRIKECVGWRHTSTFARFYNRKIKRSSDNLVPFPTAQTWDPHEDLHKAPLVEEEAKEDAFCFYCLSFTCLTPLACKEKLEHLEKRQIQL